MINSEIIDVVPIVDDGTTQSLIDANEKLLDLEEKINELTEISTTISGVDEFIVANSDLVVTGFEVLHWYGVVGVPLIVIVMLFWTVYKQFLYTNI